MTNDCRLPRRKGPTPVKDYGVSLTKQAPKAECDVNNILKKFRNTGAVTHVAQRTPYFGDVSLVESYQQGQNVILQAKQNFDSLPSRVRARFANDPLNMMKFLSDKANLKEAVQLGLVKLKLDPKAPKGKAPATKPKAQGSKIVPTPEQIAQYLKDTAK